MSQGQVMQLVCPQCGQIDQVQKVTAVVSNGSSTGLIAGRGAGNASNTRGMEAVATGNAVLAGATQTILGQRLLPPVEPKYEDDSTITVDIRAMEVVFVFGAVVLAIYVIASVLADKRWAQDGQVPGVVLASIVLVAGGMYFLATARQRSSNKRIRKAAFKSEHSRWEKAMLGWHQLYYCHRDDGVFRPGDTTLTPTDRMREYLQMD